MTSGYIRHMTSKYVEKQVRVVEQWKGRTNVPGPDFVKSFAGRNYLSELLATNIKGSRARGGEPEVKKFFQNISSVLDTDEPKNVLNYDETCVVDDAGAAKVIVPRGCRRVERVMEHSKMSTSIMFCGSAEGHLLPPMVVYKSKNLYQNWTQVERDMYASLLEFLHDYRAGPSTRASTSGGSEGKIFWFLLESGCSHGKKNRNCGTRYEGGRGRRR